MIFLGTEELQPVVSIPGAGIECWSDGVRVGDTAFTWEHSGLPIDSALWLPDEPNPNHPKYSVTIQKSSGQYGLKTDARKMMRFSVQSVRLTNSVSTTVTVFTFSLHWVLTQR